MFQKTQKNSILIINQNNFTEEDSNKMVSKTVPIMRKDEELTKEFVMHFPGFHGNL